MESAVHKRSTQGEPWLARFAEAIRPDRLTALRGGLIQVTIH